VEPRFLPASYDRAGWARLVLSIVGGVLLVLLLVLLWQGARASILLARASDQSSVLLAQVAQGDAAGARRTADVLEDAAGGAHDATDGPLWAAASWLPVLGDDVDAVRTIAREVDRVATEAVPTVVDVTTQIGLDAFSPRNGRVDIGNLEQVAPRLGRPREALEQAARGVGDIRPEDVVGRLQVPVRRLQATLTSAAGAARIADTAASLLPGMLGDQEKRRYLLLIQNNAEVRSLGGIPGSFAVIEADRGRVRMREQGSAIDVPPVDKAPVPVPRNQVGAIPRLIATDLRNTTLIPDFPQAARTAAGLVGDAVDTRFDGVVSVDPVTLGYLLEGLGAVTLDDGTRLTAANAVDELLNGVYVRYPTDPLAQDDVFEDAARRIFDAFVGGAGATQPVLESLVQASIDNRILVWSADASEQRRIARTGVAGELSQTLDRAHVGVYLNDAVGSKLQYYLEAEHVLRSTSCVDDRAQRLRLRTTLRSRVPTNVRSLPLSVTGVPFGALRRGDQRLTVRVVAPAGGVIESVQIGDTERQPVGGQLGDRRVTVVPVTIAPGDSTDLTVTMRSGDGQTGDAVLTSTPGIRVEGNDVRVRSSCES
jgi:hypothetical protein